MTSTLLHGDCLDIMPTLPDSSVDLVFTSPPYNVGKDYEKGNSTQDYINLLHGFIKQCGRILDGGGYMIINTADVLCGTDERDGVNPVLPLIDGCAVSSGFTLYDRRIWHKDPSWMNCQWVGSSVKSVDEFEYIYIYKKNGLSSRVFKFTEFFRNFRNENKLTNGDIDSVLGYKDMAGHWVSLKDSRASVPSPEQWEVLKDKLNIVSSKEIDDIVLYSAQRLRDRLSESEWSDWGSRGVWKIPSVRKNNDHPAKFPDELPSRVIRLFTWEGDTVLDPFMGSGTTGVACKQLGRDFIGIEKDDKYFEIAERRINGTMF